jgi:ABC-type molybdate transport system permease subunit
MASFGEWCRRLWRCRWCCRRRCWASTCCWGWGRRRGWGESWFDLFGHPLAFTFWGLLVGSVIYSLPFAVQPLVVGFSGVDRAVVETASVLGASPWRVFWRIVFPLSRMSFVAAAVLTFAHTVGEFGVVLMIGGDIPGKTRTLSISIFDLVQEMNYKAANETALWLVGLSFVWRCCWCTGAARRSGGRTLADFPANLNAEQPHHQLLVKGRRGSVELDVVAGADRAVDGDLWALGQRQEPCCVRPAGWCRG